VDVFRSLMDLKGLRFTLQECREIAKYLDKCAIKNRACLCGLPTVTVPGFCLIRDAKEFVQYGKLIELIERPLDVAAEEKEMPPKAPENEGIRRTHSDTTSLGKNILTDLYRTEAVQVPDVPHYETIDARDSHSPVAVKPNEGKRDVSVAAPGGLKASKATLDRISDAFTGHTTTALFKRCGNLHCVVPPLVSCNHCGVVLQAGINSLRHHSRRPCPWPQVDGCHNVVRHVCTCVFRVSCAVIFCVHVRCRQAPECESCDLHAEL
jgi:hypothetical protein